MSSPAALKSTVRRLASLRHDLILQLMMDPSLSERFASEFADVYSSIADGITKLNGVIAQVGEDRPADHNPPVIQSTNR